MAFGVFPLFLPLAITAFGGPENDCSLAIKALGAVEFTLPKYVGSLRKIFKEESRLLLNLRTPPPGQRAPKGPPNEDPSKRPTRGEFFDFFYPSSPSPHEAAVLPSASVAKNMCIFHSNELLSPEVLDRDGCSNSEKPYHDQGDSLMWAGPQ